MTPKQSAETFFTLIQAMTGLTLEDVIREELAETPEDKAREKILTLRKIHAHQQGVPLDAVPDFFNYPETGFPKATS